MCRALVTPGVLKEVQLVVVLGVPPRPCFPDLGDNLRALGGKVLCLHLVRNASCDGHLLGGGGEYCGTILRPGISALPINRRRIVRAVEKLDQLGVPHDVGVELDPQGLGVARRAVAHRPVVGVRAFRFPANVADHGLRYPLAGSGLAGVVLEEDVLRAPEAARGKYGDFLRHGLKEISGGYRGCKAGDGPGSYQAFKACQQHVHG